MTKNQDKDPFLRSPLLILMLLLFSFTCIVAFSYPADLATVVATLIGAVIALFAVLFQSALLERKRASDGLKGLKSEMQRNFQKSDNLLSHIKDIISDVEKWGEPNKDPLLYYVLFEKSAFQSFDINGRLFATDEKYRADIELLYHFVDVMNECIKRDFELSYSVFTSFESIRRTLGGNIELCRNSAESFIEIYGGLEKNGFMEFDYKQVW